MPAAGDGSPPSGQPPAYPPSGAGARPTPVAGLTTATVVVFVLAGLWYLAVALIRATVGDSSAGPAIAAIQEALSLVPLLVLGPLFLTWFFLIRRNAGLWGPQRLGQGWAIGAWFTPIALLWFPYQIAADAWRASQPLSGGGRRAPVALIAWWTCWLLAWFTGYHVTHATVTGSESAPAVTGTSSSITLGGTLLSALLAAAAAFLGAAFVRSLGRMQGDRMAEIPVQAPAWPQP